MEAENIKQPVTIVIFGVSGDLSRRYLLPALSQIAQAGRLPKGYRIVGITRRDISKETVLKDCHNLTPNFEIFKMDLDRADDYGKLKDRLGDGGQIIFHFAIPPDSSPKIIKHLGEAGLNGRNVKLLIEKPFGFDLDSAKEVIASTAEYFSQDQVYRIDHYLAKEMAQNITVFLSSNTLFRSVWNNRFIDKIEIIATEKIGIEGRNDFYEQTGALRDFVQSHLLQLAALTLMEACPDPFDFGDLSQRRLAALKMLAPVDASTDAYRAQYEGYRQEVGNSGSSVETFVELTLHSTASRWEGVPIRLVTGKNLIEKKTAICVHFKKSHTAEANLLMLHVQPNEGIEIDVWAKEPGYEYKIKKQKLQFSYGQDYGRLPDAYEQVLVEAMAGNHSLFAADQEILESWRILQPVLDQWAKGSDDLGTYRPGSSLEQVLGGVEKEWTS